MGILNQTKPTGMRATPSPPVLIVAVAYSKKKSLIFETENVSNRSAPPTCASMVTSYFYEEQTLL